MSGIGRWTAREGGRNPLVVDWLWLACVTVGLGSCGPTPSDGARPGGDTGDTSDVKDTGSPVDDTGNPDDTGESDTGEPDTGELDEDGDGVTIEEGDCDDGDADVRPGAPEIWSDGVDQDCDGVDRTHADACAAAAPCPDATGHYNNADAWASVEQCSSIPGMLSWTPQSGPGQLPNTCVESVGMDVVVDGAVEVATLAPLSRVREVGGDVKLVGLPALSSLQGLEALRETGEHILLIRNDTLVDVSALTDVERISRKLSIEQNPLLTDLSPLLGIGRVDETLTILGNASLCEAEVDPLVAHLQGVNPDLEVQVGDNGGC